MERRPDVTTEDLLLLDTKNFRTCAIQISTRFFNGIRYHQGCFYLYNGTHYEPCTDKELKGRIRACLAKCHESVKSDGDETHDRKIVANKALIGEIIEEMQSLWMLKDAAPTFTSSQTAEKYEHPANE